MRLIGLSVVWLLILLLALTVVLYILKRNRLLEVGTRFTLSDIANFVSVLLAVFALAFTLATVTDNPQPDVEVIFRQSLEKSQPEVTLTELDPNVELDESKISKFSIRRTGKLFFLLENTGDGPLRNPIYIVTAKPVETEVKCAEEFPQFRPDTDKNICQFNNPQDVYPSSQSGIPSAFGFTLRIPPDVSTVNLSLMLLSSNTATRAYELELTVLPD